MKKILFLSGGPWQIPWASFLKNKGHELLLVDPNAHPPVLPWADHHIALDVKDVNGIIRALENMGWTPDLVTSEQTDVSVIPVAMLNQHFGLPGIPVETTRLFSNKLLSRQFVKEKVPSLAPDFQKISSAENLQAFIAANPQKTFILKPADAQSSRGILKLLPGLTTDELSRAFESCRRNSPSGEVLAEEMLQGIELTVEGISIQGQHHILGISQKKHFRFGIASELCYPPHTIPLSHLSRLESLHNQLINSCGLSKGLTHSEYFWNPETGSFALVELSCRGGGTLIPSTIIPAHSGVDVYEIWYQLLVNDKLPERLPPWNSKERPAVALCFFEFEAGKVVEISGIEQAKEKPGVLQLQIDIQPGHRIKEALDDRGRHGFVILTGRNGREIEERFQAIQQSIKVNYAS